MVSAAAAAIVCVEHMVGSSAQRKKKNYAKEILQQQRQILQQQSFCELKGLGFRGLHLFYGFFRASACRASILNDIRVQGLRFSKVHQSKTFICCCESFANHRMDRE